jgi:hypothetical protein
VYQAARTLASDITERGARLYDLLAQEGKLQQARAKSLRFLDSISSNLQSTSENEYIERSGTRAHAHTEPHTQKHTHITQASCIV